MHCAYDDRHTSDSRILEHRSWCLNWIYILNLLGPACLCGNFIKCTRRNAKSEKNAAPLFSSSSYLFLFLLPPFSHMVNAHTYRSHTTIQQNMPPSCEQSTTAIRSRLYLYRVCRRRRCCRLSLYCAVLVQSYVALRFRQNENMYLHRKATRYYTTAELQKFYLLCSGVGWNRRRTEKLW